MKTFNKLLATSLSRRQFLTYLGTALLTLVGVTSILNKLTGRTPSDSSKHSQGYGSSAYGGKEKT